MDFLEANFDYGLIYTNLSKQYVEEGIMLQDIRNDKMPEGKIYKKLLSTNNIISTCTTLCRTSIIKSYTQKLNPVYFTWLMSDYPLWLFISLRKKIKYLPDNTAVYRKLEHSAINTTQKNKLLFSFSIFKVRIYFLFHESFRLWPFIKSVFQFLKESTLGTIKILLNYKSKPTELKNLHKSAFKPL